MALKRRKILTQMLNLGFGTDTIPADSGGNLLGDKIGLHTFMGEAVISASAFPDEPDFGAKVVAAIAALPFTGGTVDASGFAGPQEINQNMFEGLSKPLHLILGPIQYNLTVTQRITQCQGCYIEGVGGAETQSTRFLWLGTANGTMFSVYSTEWSRFSNFALNGNGNSGYAMEVTGSNAIRATQRNVFECIDVRNSGYGFYVGSGSSQDISQNTFNNITIEDTSIGVYQEGTQTVQNYWSRLSAFRSASYGFYAKQGDIHISDSLFINDPDSTALAFVYIDPEVNWASFINVDGEVNGGGSARKFYWFGTGARQGFATQIIGGRVKWDNTGGNPIYYDQSSSLLLTGWTLQSDSGTGTGEIIFSNTASTGGQARLTAHGNQISSGFTMTLGETNVLASMDSHFAGLAATQLAGVTPLPTTLYAPGTTGSKFLIFDSAPELVLKEYGATPEAGSWGFQAEGDSLHFRLLSDSRLVATDWLQVTRASTTLTAVTLPLNVQVGTGGTVFSRMRLITVAVTPLSCPANSTLEMTVDVSAATSPYPVLTTASVAIGRTPAITVGVAPISAWVLSTNIILMVFMNTTSGALSATAGSYQFILMEP